MQTRTRLIMFCALAALMLGGWLWIMITKADSTSLSVGWVITSILLWCGAVGAALAAFICWLKHLYGRDWLSELCVILTTRDIGTPIYRWCALGGMGVLAVLGWQTGYPVLRWAIGIVVVVALLLVAQHFCSNTLR